MLYRPEKGKLWDPTVLRWQGRFYLFTMYYAPGGSESYACRLAVSEDGVHWEDRGNVLTDERPVWKCGVLRTGDGRFYMNYGTTSGQGVNDMMGYAVSDDLVHWEKTGYDAPDPRWYEPHERWDHMYCRESERSGLCARRDGDPDRGGTPALLVYPHRRLGRLPLRPAGHRKPVGRRPRAPRPRRADAFPAARAARHRPALPRRAALPDLCLRPPPGDALGGCEERPRQPDRTAGVPDGALKMQGRRRHNPHRRLTLEHLKQPPLLPAVVARLDADEDRVAADDLDLIPRNHHVFLPSEDAEALETSRHDHRLDAGGGRNATAGSLVSIGQGYALLATAKLRAQQPDEYRFDNKKGVGGSHIVDLCFAQSEAGTDLPVRFSCSFSSEHVFAERLSFCLLSGHDSAFCCSFYSTTEGASFPCPFSRV